MRDMLFPNAGSVIVKRKCHITVVASQKIYAHFCTLRICGTVFDQVLEYRIKQPLVTENIAIHRDIIVEIHAVYNTGLHYIVGKCEYCGMEIDLLDRYAVA